MSNIGYTCTKIEDSFYSNISIAKTTEAVAVDIELENRERHV